MTEQERRIIFERRMSSNMDMMTDFWAENYAKDTLALTKALEEAEQSRDQAQAACATMRKIIEWKLQLIKDTTNQDWVKEMIERRGHVCFCEDGSCWPCKALETLSSDAGREILERLEALEKKS